VKEYYFYVRQHAHALYMKYLYKYSPAEYPYRGFDRENRGGRGRRSQYELLQTRAFLRRRRYFECSWNMQAGHLKTSSYRVGAQSRARGARLRVAAHAVVPNTWSWGDDEPKTFPALRWGLRVDSRVTPELGEYWLSSMDVPSAVHR